MMLAAVRDNAANISERVTKYSSTLNVPYFSPNSTEHIGRELYLYVITYTENKYIYADNRRKVNSGTTRLIIRNKDGEYIDLYSHLDQLQMVVRESNVLNDRTFWTDIVDVITNETFVLNATFYNNMDGALMNVEIKAITPCNVTGYDASSGGQDLLLDLHLVSGSNMTISQQPSNLKITYQNQSLGIVFVPPDIGDMTSFDLFFNCEVCLYGQMSFLIVLSREVTRNDYDCAMNFVKGMIDYLNLEFSLHVFGTYLQTIFTFDYHVNSSMDVNTYYNLSSISKSGLYNANLDWALNNMTSFVMANANWSKRQFLVLITDGYFDVNSTLDDVVNEASVLHNLPVTIVGVKYGTYSVNAFNLEMIVHTPPEWYIFTLGRNPYTAVKTLALQELMGNICYGDFWNRDYNKMRFGRVSAFALNYTSNKWERSTDIKMKDISMETETITFQSNFLGTFGSNVFVLPPELINFDELFVDFAAKLADTPYVLAVNVTCMVLLVLLTIILRHWDTQDNVLWNYQSLADNNNSDKYSYFLSFYTGFWSSRRLSATPYIILRGSRATTSIRILQDVKRGNFQRWTLQNFLLKTDKNLGILCEVEIGHDGKGDSPGWFLEKILVYDSVNNEKNIFLCGNWLSPDRGDCKLHRKLYTARTELNEGRVLFGSNTKFNLFDDFLLLSLFSRPSSSRFTRVQRCVSVFAMLFLTMLATAMWYRTLDDAQTYGIHVGPFHLNYKQFYVGFMSSSITILPGILMAWIFRNRYQKTDHLLLNKGFLPWWTVIIGYVFAFSCIIAGATFTFFYSLQWERETTVDWLMSFFLGTTHGVLFIEPIKVVLLTLLVAFLCKKYAKRDLEEMATIRMSTYSVTHEKDNENRENEQTQLPADQLLADTTDTRRRKMAHRKTLLDRKLLTLYRSLLIKTCYITLLTIICAHNAVWTSFLQNSALENLLTPAQKINTSDDIWSWLRGRLADHVFPKFFYNGDFRLTEERRYLFDDVSYRISSMRLRQVRVNGKCDVPAFLDALITICPPSYSRNNMDTTNYCAGWIPRNNRNCKGTEWTYKSDDETNALPTAGLEKVYNGGGYVKLLDPELNISDVRNELYSMQSNNWIDKFTRFVVIEFMLFNPNSKLFSLPKLMIEIPATGGFFTNIKIKTTRLYPYIDVFDFFVLGIQVIFLFITFSRFLHLVYSSWKLGKYCCTIAQWIYLLSVGVSITSIVFYVIRIDRTVYTVEEINNSPGKFVSLDLLDLMDTSYKVCISLELFIAVIDLLSPLTLNHSLYLMRTSVSFCGKDLVYLGLASMIPMTAFAILCYCYLGPHQAEFKDISSSYTTLFRTLLAMIKVQDTFDSDDIFSGLIFSVFLLLMTIVVVNVNICILNAALSRVKETGLVSTEFKTYDKDLQKHFWRTINNTLKMFQRRPKSNNSNLLTFSDNTHIWNLVITLDNQIFKVLGHLEQAHVDDVEDLEAYIHLHKIITKRFT
ncbi:polycystin-1-like protein 2 [Ylistrum balloti]|uniref:polycystin-1-like protein 2 n=1 Tax=Ylistrum balloti TaxID=509963 RepID=UPI002905E476|nr:polycystin-1-like protein 2 [Ylistrum balloti]